MTKSLLFLGICLVGLASAVASDLNFTLVNETGRSFEAVYISASDDPDWDGNLLTEGVTFAPPGKLAVVFEDAPKTATWDLNIVDSDGISVTFKAVNLVDVETITLTGRDGNYTAEIE
jgi:hypothetical protein